MMLEDRKNIIFPILIAASIVVVSLIVYISNIVSTQKISDPKKSLTIEKKYLKPVSLIRAPSRKDDAKEPLIYANNVALIDVTSMYLLYGKNEKASVPIASITKLMTALITVENFNPNDKITVEKQDVMIEGSKVGLVANEQMTVDSLLNGLLIVSGNDAASALSHHNMKAEEFVALMNKRARELGMKETNFLDPAGLNDQGRSSAYDIGILLSQTLKNEKIVSFISKAQETIKSVDGSSSHDLKNSNRLVTDEMHYDGIIGGKTGFTPDAGHSLASAAKINGRIMVAIVLNTADTSKAASAIETRKLFDWARNSLFYDQ